MRAPFRLRLRVAGSQRNLRCLGALLRLVVAVAQRHALAEGLRGQVVQVSRVGLKAEAYALHVLCHGEVADTGCTALAVGDGGIEDADAVELHAVALCYELGDALGELREHGDDVATVAYQPVLYHVVGETSRGERSLTVHVGEPAVIDGRLIVAVLAEHVAHD